MENARYAMNDDTAGFVNQMKTQVGKLSMTWN
jgi:predicted phage gp36 major capsid-like protein